MSEKNVSSSGVRSGLTLKQLDFAAALG